VGNGPPIATFTVQSRHPTVVRVENTFIPVRGVGETTERKLWRRGVTHWDEFDPDAVGPTRAERIESFIDEARDRLDRSDAGFFADALPGGEHWRLYENFRNDAAFFDIETTGLSRYSDVTTVSVRRGGDTTTLVQGRDLTQNRLADLLDAPLLVTFNGRTFDAPFLEREYDLDLDAPHVDLRYACDRIGLSGGLGAVERELGVERDRPDISGEDAVRLWREYQRGDESALDTLVSYNREDTDNLVRVMEAAADALHDDVFASVCGDGHR